MHLVVEHELTSCWQEKNGLSLLLHVFSPAVPFESVSSYIHHQYTYVTSMREDGFQWEPGDKP